MRMNLNDFAKQITLKEGLKKSLSIGQVKEVIRLVLLALKDMTLEEIVAILRKIKR